MNMEKGEYFYSGGREFLKIEKDTDHPVSINFASSGQQEILWMLNFMYVLMLRQENVFLIIEEPEAHTHPQMQYVFVRTGSTYLSIAAEENYGIYCIVYQYTGERSIYYNT